MTTQKQASILVVDDEPVNVELMEAILGEDYNIQKAYSGTDAFQAIESEKPDLILLDIMMPDISGHEVCARLRQEEDTKIIPVVMITALQDKNEKIKGLENGADDFLTKPVNAVALRARIRTLLKVKKLQEDIYQERNLARKYIDVIGSVMLILDKDLNIQLANQKSNRVFGSDPGKLNGLNLVDTFIPENEKDKIRAWMSDFSGKMKSEFIETFITSKDGEKKLLRWRMATLHENTGEIKEIVLSAEDITAQKDTEKRLLEANRELETIDQIKNDFIANMSHELRTPLIPIKGFSELLYQERLGDLNEKQKSIAGSIARNTYILQKLIESLFYITNDIRKTIKYSSSPLDIKKIVRNTIDDISVHFEKKQLTPVFEMPDGLPPVRGNRPYLERVLMHLLDDIIDASPHDTSISISASRQQGNIIIRMENQMEPMYMLVPLRQKDMAGISICKGIIEAHNGELSVNEENGFCQITVALPYQQNSGAL
ncbi:PAS domain S-box-containing protein [Methanohalophilus levihalophilus]|uniref:hybrid sensor histidine kinase/response regulator n=1 Tax=Methanohalophilus levihalophilus TaxID=1431282 RepID=UPI001AE50E90|nr:response regulator [Methanohalophilus levihalophilus]MBP2029825.1 PAS domain S-box-containing protein [Methanohalophilus levihalophilus]